MPIYGYKCPECGSEFEEVKSIELRLAATCNCGAPATLIVGGRFTYRSFNYFDRSLGVRITGPNHKNRVLNERNVIEAGDIRHFDDIKPENPQSPLESKESEESFYRTWQRVVG